MKKRFVFPIILGLIFFSSSSLLAGGADNKTNWSAEYIRTLNRNAATDSADIVMYNPAGVMKMDNGLFLNFSAQYLLKDYNNKINGKDYDQDEPSIIPGLFAVYKQDRWAGFFGVSNVVGGGKVNFDKGNATTSSAGYSIITGVNGQLGPAINNPALAPVWTAIGQTPNNFLYNTIKSQNLKAEQTGLGYTFGGAYKVNDGFSVALAARYVRTKRDMQGTITVGAANPMPAAIVAINPALNNPDRTTDADFNEEAKGWGAVLGLNIAPTEFLNIGIRYETKVNLDFDQTVNKDTLGILPSMGVTNGGTRTRNLPAILAVGASYQLNPKVRLETDLTYYLNKDAGFKDIPGTSRDESAVDNGYDLGISCEYAFNSSLKGSIGYLYTKTGVEAKDMTPELPELDAHTLGTGIVWKLNPKFDMNFSLGKVFYQSKSFTSSTTGATIEYEKDITFIAAGIQYKFF